MPGVLIFDPETQDLSLGDDQAVGVYLDIESDTLYLTDLTNIIEWEGAASDMIYTWRSGRIRLPKKVNLGGLLVEADSYDSVIVKVYAVPDADLVLITTVTATDNEPIRLPGGYISNLFEIEVVSSDRVTGIAVAQNLFDLAAG